MKLSGPSNRNMPFTGTSTSLISDTSTRRASTACRPSTLNSSTEDMQFWILTQCRWNTMTSKTYEQILALHTADAKRNYPNGPIPSDLIPYIERDADHDFQTQFLPVIQPKVTKKGIHYWSCPKCNRRLSRNFNYIDGYGSLNCVTHGWVGKWGPR